MKILLLLSFFITGVCFGEPAVIVAARHTYSCEKGSKKFTYRISYRDAEGKPPCRVYDASNGKRKVIAESKKTVDICEKVIDRILQKLGKEGMSCTKIN